MRFLMGRTFLFIFGGYIVKKRSFLVGVLLLLVVVVFASCNSNDNDNNMSYKYHRQNIEELSNTLGSTVATSVVTALEKSCAIEETTKLVGQDLIKIYDNCYELYSGLMTRFYIDNDNITLYTFETSYSEDSKILLYSSYSPSDIKVLTSAERNSLIYTQRRSIVHSTVTISPYKGALLHNALGSTKIDLSFRNQSYPAITYLNVVITPSMSGTSFSSKNKAYVLDCELPVSGNVNKSITTTGWTGYDSYKITQVTVMFADGTTIGLNSFDCQFLDGSGDSPETILKDSQVVYHLYDETVETEYFYSGFGKGLKVPYRYGYDFIGWYDNKEYDGTPFEKINIGTPVNLELYAKWEEKTHINFNYQYDEKKEKVYVENNALVNLPAPERLGYTFDGWYDNQSFSGNAITELPNLRDSIELYAKWVGNTVYLMYDGNGSTSGEMNNQLFYVGDTLALNENKFSRDGYTFIGWSIEKTSNDIIEDKAEYTMQPTSYEIVKIYAKWAKEIKTVADFNTINENNASYYTLANDIDFLGQIPITVEKFYGVFNGNGYCLKNSNGSLLYDNFGEITNLKIQDCVFACNESDYAGVCGGLLLNNFGLVSACEVVAIDPKKANSYYNEMSANKIGGLCVQNSGTIKNSSTTIEATLTCYVNGGSVFVGGICAINDGAILNSFSNNNLLIKLENYGWTHACSYIGGLVGRNSTDIQIHASINNCYTTGNIEFEISQNMDYDRSISVFAGGLIGTFYHGMLSNSFSNVNLKSIFEMNAGGLVGASHVYSSVSTQCSRDINNCFALGKIDILEGSCGGLIAFTYSCNTVNCYRSDINLFATETVCKEGILTESEEFYSKEFYINNNLLDLYVGKEALQENENAVWIIVDGELPKLYWE